MQCKVDADLTDEDELLTLYIQAAREMAEIYTKRTFVEARYKLTLTDFPCDGRIELPQGPVQTVHSVTYLDRDGERQVASGWEESLDSIPAFILSSSWPSATCRLGSVAVEYTAGYPSGGSPTDSALVPAGVKQAILFLVGFWFENREAVNIGNITSTLPFGWEDALFPYRVLT